MIKLFFKKKIKIAYINFSKNQLNAIKKCLPRRNFFLKKVLWSKTIIKAIKQEAHSKKISIKKSRRIAISLIKEISANFSYKAIRISDFILSTVWSHLYCGLYIYNINRVHLLVNQEHEIVYIPCHRSHMDYLLLSYIIYHQKLMPPHIAAGLNLNFWPIGFIFRRLGAFFIRRTFKKNKLYSTIFREYLSELFINGYSVEYFIEGGRSRTGRLLEPKTGTLTMTVQTVLRSNDKKITIIPIYIGYEHVIEVSSYIEELSGISKKREGFIQMMLGLFKLRNLGNGYINFGEPISLTSWLTRKIPQWRNVSFLENKRPSWLCSAVNDIAHTIMVRINNSVVVNSINLCSSALLASCCLSLSRKELLLQLTCYLDLLNNVPYTKDIIIPNNTPEKILKHALSLNKFFVNKHQHTMLDEIFLSKKEAILMTYYRNNIQHLLILPSLLANIIIKNPGIDYEKAYQWILLIYPMIKAELFIRFTTNKLFSIINSLIIELQRQNLIVLYKKRLYPDKFSDNKILCLLAENVQEPLQRYTITFSLLYFHPQINVKFLEKKSCLIAKRLSSLCGIDSPEFSDKSIFSKLIATLKIEGYIINDCNNVIFNKINKINKVLYKLISYDILISIKNLSKNNLIE